MSASRTALVTGASSGVRGRLARARDVAAAGYRALGRGRRIAIPGVMNRLMTASIRFSPRSLVIGISRRMLEVA